MSRAFVKEEDGSRPEALPELPVSAAPNRVTARGLRLIGARVAEIEAALAEGPDAEHAARLKRDLRYWALRHATAQVEAPDPADGSVQFGSRVSWRTEDGAERTAVITGEDEADPASGRLAWTSPVARALLGATPGAWVTLQRPGGAAEVEVLRVETPDEDG